jgi:small subunit ribosomal protein S3
MIERKIITEKLQEYMVHEFIAETMKRVGHSKTEVVKTPVGEKIILHASRPGLIVGAKGANIKKLTKVLKTKFKFENPQLDVAEIEKPEVDPQLVAENIAYQLEKFGPQRFKGIGYQAMEHAVKGGALGIEILLSGKLPSARAKTWRFYLGYLKKCGDVAMSKIKVAYVQAALKSGIIGIQVRIMPSDIVLPDTVRLYREMSQTDGKVTKPLPVSIMDEVAKEAKELPVPQEVVPAPTNISQGKKSAPRKRAPKAKPSGAPSGEQ